MIANNCENVVVSKYSCLVETNNKALVYVGDAYFACSETGQCIAQLLSPVEWRGNDNKELAISLLSSCLAVPLMTHSFMHCKNIKLQSQEPSAKLSKSFERRYGRPLTRYHTLEIEPMKEVLETEGGIGHNGLKKALHICRGHFAHYTPDKGFLGRKIEQPITVWRPAHRRGSSQFGTVVKDYKVKAP